MTTWACTLSISFLSSSTGPLLPPFPPSVTPGFVPIQGTDRPNSNISPASFVLIVHVPPTAILWKDRAALAIIRSINPIEEDRLGLYLRLVVNLHLLGDCTMEHTIQHRDRGVGKKAGGQRNTYVG